ncbi:MAG: aminotransferase class I/II-fold pyridoxal phosphate-dependent enzyme, partial [Bacillota bacterium]
LERYPNLILTRTFSKAYGLAGLRIGYGLARPEIWSPLLTVREPFSVGAIAQAAALAALHDEDHLTRTLAVNREGKAYLAELCRDLGLTWAESEANFLLIDLGRPAQPVFEALLRQGVIVRPCGGFGRPTTLRVTVGTPEQNQRFAEALRTALQA